jgi:predicted glutamine amidotransferase
MDKDEMLFHMSEAKPYVAHARYMTAGKICKENIHLFEQGDWLVAMNGTISGFANKTANDTKLALEILKTIPRKKDKIAFMEMWEARFLCINRKTKEVIRTGKWVEKEGVQYSKNNVLQTFQSGKQPYYDYADGYYDYQSYGTGSSKWDNKGSKSTVRNSWNTSNSKKQQTVKDDNSYVNVNGMWVTRSSQSKGLYGTKKDDRVFGLLADKTPKINETGTKKQESVILNANHNDIVTEASGLVLVSVYGYLLSNYRCREILDNAMFLGHSRISAKVSMVENHGTAYMLPLSDKDSKYVTTLTYQLKVDQYRQLMAAACAPSYVVPMRKTVALSDAASTTVVSYVFILNQKSAIETMSTNARLETSKKLIEKERTLAV